MIKELREQKGYTQQQMAEMMKISLRHYVRIDTEKTIPRVDVFKELIRILEMTPEEIGRFILNVIENKAK